MVLSFLPLTILCMPKMLCLVFREGDWYWQRTLSPIEDFVWAEGRPSLGIDGNYLCLSAEQGFLAADCETESKAVAICQK